MSKTKKKKPYYGKKGGSATYNDEIQFDLKTTLKKLKDYYKGKTSG
ncbi:MAG TPA: hypothetical protein VHE53_05665 [Patescibacteria group bacterium]|nr:hypothetical protein [Patescibacteria group bacterium]